MTASQPNSDFLKGQADMANPSTVQFRNCCIDAANTNISRLRITDAALVHGERFAVPAFLLLYRQQLAFLAPTGNNRESL